MSDRTTLEAIQMALNTFHHDGDALRVANEIAETMRYWRQSPPPPFPLIELGHGLIEVGYSKDPPALYFGRNGKGKIGEVVRDHKPMPEAEIIAVVSFENVASLDVVAGGLAAIRKELAGGHQPPIDARPGECWHCGGSGIASIGPRAWRDAETKDSSPLPDETRAATSRRAHDTEDAGRPGPSHEKPAPLPTEEYVRDLRSALSPDETNASPVCASCQGTDEVAIRPICCKEPICKHCFAIWYDGAPDAETIRRESLQLQGRSESEEGSRG